VWFEENAILDGEQVLRLLEDADADVRARTRKLATRRHAQAVYESLLADVSNPDVTVQASMVLALWRDWKAQWWDDPRDVLTVLGARLSDSNEHVRAAALTVLQDMGERGQATLAAHPHK